MSPTQAQRVPQLPSGVQPVEVQSVMFRPDRPRQPELLRQLEERNPQPVRSMLQSTSRPTTEFKPYQLKPKRGTNMEPFLEPPIVEPPTELPPDPKNLKQMKKLDELNRKIRHSKKRHNRLIHK